MRLKLSGFGVLGFRSWGFGFRVSDLGFRVRTWGLGFRVRTCMGFRV